LILRGVELFRCHACHTAGFRQFGWRVGAAKLAKYRHALSRIAGNAVEDDRILASFDLDLIRVDPDLEGIDAESAALLTTSGLGLPNQVLHPIRICGSPAPEIRAMRYCFVELRGVGAETVGDNRQQVVCFDDSIRASRLRVHCALLGSCFRSHSLRLGCFRFQRANGLLVFFE